MLDSMNIYMGVSENSGTPKWMVYNGKPYENGWFGGIPIFGNIHIFLTDRKLADLLSTKTSQECRPQACWKLRPRFGVPIRGGDWLVADANITPCWNCTAVVLFGGGKNGAIFDLMIDYMTCERMRLNQHGIENHHDLIILIDFPWFSCHAVALCM